MILSPLLSVLSLLSSVTCVNPIHKSDAHIQDYLSYSTLNKNNVNDSSANCTRPPNFPNGIQLDLEDYENWSKEILVSGIWIARPRTPEHVVQISNWARQTGYRVRASGYHHNWSPLTTPKPIKIDEHNCLNVILVSTIEHLKTMRMLPPIEQEKKDKMGRVWVEAGASLGDLLQFVQDNGHGMAFLPAIGDISVGGALAVGAHGSGILAKGETLQKGHTLGSFSNLVIDFTAVVWTGQKYHLKTFHRSDPEAKYFLVSLGRTFIVSVTLRVGPQLALQCKSYFGIQAKTLLADPNSLEYHPQKSLSQFLNKSGRVDIIWYPFTEKPWIKVWTVTPKQPRKSRKVSGPYNYEFSHQVPPEHNLLFRNMIRETPGYIASLGPAMYSVSLEGVQNGDSKDLWGQSKDLLFFIRSSTARFSEYSLSVMTRRSNVQHLVHLFYTRYNELLHNYARENKYPVNGLVELRVTGLDDPRDVFIDGAETPSISSSSLIPSCPELDTVVSISILSFSQTLYRTEFSWEIQKIFYETFPLKNAEKCDEKTVALVRLEWSKGFAVGVDKAMKGGQEGSGGSWRNEEILKNKIPHGFSQWRETVCTFKKYDPANIFTKNAGVLRLWLHLF